MPNEQFPIPSLPDDERLLDPEVARSAAEAERPLRNALHHGRNFVVDKPEFQRTIERLANEVGSKAAEEAATLKTVRALIKEHRDILRSAGALTALVKYADRLEDIVASKDMGD